MPVRDKQYMQVQRKRITEAAFRCFSRQGFQKTTIRAICKEAGLASGTLYVHFKDRNDILSSIKLMGYEQPLEDIQLNNWGEFCDYLISKIDIKNNPTSLEYINCDLKLAAEALNNEIVADLFKKSAREMYDWIKNCLSQFVAQGEIELPLGIDITAQSIRYLINGLAFSQPFEGPAEQENLADVFNLTVGALIIRPIALSSRKTLG